MRRPWRAILAITVLALVLTATAPAVATARPITPALSPAPNSSVVLYRAPHDGKPGRLRSGTVTNSGYKQKAAIKTGRWSHIAAGRDTLALYDRRTGRLTLGTLKGGRFHRTSSRKIAKGYTAVAASCDSVAFYKRSTGKLVTAELTSGGMRDVRSTNVGPDYDSMAATCDSLILRDDTGSGSRFQTGLLRDGHFVGTGSAFVERWSHSAGNRTSHVVYLASNGGGIRSPYDEGVSGTGFAFTIPTGLDILAGAGDRMLFYERSTGAAIHWRVLDGVSTDLGSTTLGKNLTIIAGAR